MYLNVEDEDPDDDGRKKLRQESVCSLASYWCGCALAQGRRRCGVLLAVPCIFLLAWRWEMQRWRHLDPLMRAIQTSELCHYEGSPRCTLRMRPGDVFAYDLDSPREDELLGFLWAQAAHRDDAKMREILRGAYILLPANGSHGGSSTYNWLRTTEGAYSRGWQGRGSSHASSVEQFQIIEGTALCCVLTGVVNDRTWLQFEGTQYNFADPSMFWSNLGHTADFVVYSLYFRFGAGSKLGPLRLGPTRNVGPLGLAVHTEARPLLVDRAVTAQEACPHTCAAPGDASGSADNNPQPSLPRSSSSSSSSSGSAALSVVVLDLLHHCLRWLWLVQAKGLSACTWRFPGRPRIGQAC